MGYNDNRKDTIMPKPLVITDHARYAMQLRRVSKDEVIEILANPEVTDMGNHGIKRYFRGRLCVVTLEERDRLIIKTVLYRYADRWTDEDVRRRNPLIR